MIYCPAKLQNHEIYLLKFRRLLQPAILLQMRNKDIFCAILQSIRLNREPDFTVEFIRFTDMSKSTFPLVFATAVLVQTLAFSQSVDPSEVRQVSYQDNDTVVQATSDDAGTYDVFYDRLA